MYYHGGGCGGSDQVDINQPIKWYFPANTNPSTTDTYFINLTAPNNNFPINYSLVAYPLTAQTVDPSKPITGVGSNAAPYIDYMFQSDDSILP